MHSGTFERVVDAAQPEAPGDLGVQVRVVAELVGGDETRRHPVRVGGRGRPAGVGEDAVEDLRAVLVEVVVAQPAGQAQPVAQVIGRLAEERELVELVVQVGVVEDVLARAELPRGGDPGGVLEAGHEQALPVVAPGAAVEAAGHPLEAVPAAGEADLLGPHLGGRGVVERCVERVDALGKADGAAGDARGEGARVSHHEDVAVREGGDRRERHVAEAVGEVEVGENELVGEGLVDLGEQLALAEGHRGAGRRVGVGQDVVVVDAVPAVHLGLLVEEPRGDGQSVARGEPDRRAHARPIAGVDVLLHAEVGLHGVHVAREPVVVRRDAEGRSVAQGRVDAQLDVAALVAAVDAAAAELAEPPRHPRLGLVADVAHRARERPGAEQGALRTAQHLDAGQVEEVEVRREQRERDDRLVQVGAHRLLDAGHVASDLAGRHAPDRDLALAGAEVLHAEAGHVRRHALEVRDAPLLQFLFGRRRHREGHLANRRVALQRGDRDLLRALGGEREARP